MSLGSGNNNNFLCCGNTGKLNCSDNHCHLRESFGYNQMILKGSIMDLRDFQLAMKFSSPWGGSWAFPRIRAVTLQGKCFLELLRSLCYCNLPEDTRISLCMLEETELVNREVGVGFISVLLLSFVQVPAQKQSQCCISQAELTDP